MHCYMYYTVYIFILSELLYHRYYPFCSLYALIFLVRYYMILIVFSCEYIYVHRTSAKLLRECVLKTFCRFLFYFFQK